MNVTELNRNKHMIYVKQSTNLGALRLMKPYTPNRAGARWHPLKHSLLVDETVRQVKNLGWGSFCPVVYATPKKHAECVFSMDVFIPGINVDDLGAVVSIGGYNSHLGFNALKLYSGIRLLNKNCGVPMEELTIGDHEPGLEEALGSNIKVALTYTSSQVPEWRRRVARWKRTMISSEDARARLMKAAEQKLIAFSHMGAATSHLPQQNDMTVWGLIAAFIRANQLGTPTKQLRSAFLFSQSF